MTNTVTLNETFYGSIITADKLTLVGTVTFSDEAIETVAEAIAAADYASSDDEGRYRAMAKAALIKVSALWNT